MSSRYAVVSPWSPVAFSVVVEGFEIQEADVQDTRTGRVYSGDARRVVRTDTGKPAVRGKGGSVPFIGESAWSNAERLFHDLALAKRYGR